MLSWLPLRSPSIQFDDLGSGNFVAILPVVIEPSDRLLLAAFDHMGIDHRRLDVRMTHQFLHCSQVDARCHKPRPECVPERMERRALDARFLTSQFEREIYASHLPL